MDTDKVLFKQGDTTVTTARFIVGSQTYAIRNITSVKAQKTESNEPQPRLWLLFGMGGLLFGFFDGNWLIGLGGLAAAAYGVLSLSKKRAVFEVVLTTAGGEVRACASEDESHIDGIVKGLNDAIVSLG